MAPVTVARQSSYEAEERGGSSRFLRMICVGLFWVLVPLCQSDRLQAAELEGLAPISFGMSEEEAWAVVDGPKEWDRPTGPGRYLIYEAAIEGTPWNWQVSQSFGEDGAGSAAARYDAGLVSRSTCREQGRLIAGLFQSNHGVRPGRREDVPIKTWAYFPETDRHKINDIYVFTFDRGAQIRIFVYSTPWMCIFNVYYLLEPARLIPF